MKRSFKTGFTLVEVIVAIVISALAMAALLPFLGDVFLLAHEPRVQLRDALSLQSVMEDLVAFHTNGLDVLRVEIGNEGTRYRGTFRVVDNHYTAFNNTVEIPPATNNLLKVTLENGLGETVTRLFTEPL